MGIGFSSLGGEKPTEGKLMPAPSPESCPVSGLCVDKHVDASPSVLFLARMGRDRFL